MNNSKPSSTRKSYQRRPDCGRQHPTKGCACAECAAAREQGPASPDQAPEVLQGQPHTVAPPASASTGLQRPSTGPVQEPFTFEQALLPHGVPMFVDQQQEAQQDEEGAQYGDPRRCPHHPHVTTSSPDGLFDAPCGECEAEQYEAATAPWNRNMNDEQATVIAHDRGPLYCAAVAGCGKTRAVVNRIARLVHDGAQPERILAVTFSKKAADEMNDRLHDDLGITTARVGTWHSLALQVLKEDQLQASKWSIDERDRNKGFIKEAVGYRYLDWKGADVTALRMYIGVCKANLWADDSPEALDAARAKFGHDASKAVQAYRISDELTHGAALLTFDDMLVFCARHLQIDDNAARWGARWDYVLQDEAQDANVVQMTIAEALAQRHRNYAIVGDPAQSIYGFRGSSPLHFTAFVERWGAAAVYMNRNYRSGRAIVEAANRAIAPAEVRLPVDMVAMRDFEGSARATVAETLEDEGAAFVEWVQQHQQDGGALSDVACLFRTNAQSRALEEALLAAKVPYVVIGGSSFYERKEVKDLLAYLRVAMGRDTTGDAVKRCINAPFRYLGLKFTDRVMLLGGGPSPAGPNDWPAVVAQAARGAGIQRRQQVSAEEWADLIVATGRKVHEGAAPGEVLQWLVDRTGYLAWLQKEEGEESIESSHAANVRELVRVAGRFSTCTELLDYIERSIKEAAQQRRSQRGERVMLMSIHRSKGLEWPLVWVCGCVDGVLPHAKGDPEEERRLFYVAVTRARDAVVCSAVGRMATGAGVRVMQPSRFLFDAGLLQRSTSV